MRDGRPGTHIPEYHPHPSRYRSARGPGLRTGRCPPRGTSPYKELVSPKVPGLYGGQNHGCSSKLQNSVNRFSCASERREAPQLRTSYPQGGREKPCLGWQVSLQRPNLQGATFWPAFLLQHPFSHRLPFRRGVHTHYTPLCSLRQASVLAKTAAGSRGYLCFPSSLARSQCPLSQPVFLVSLL